MTQTMFASHRHSFNIRHPIKGLISQVQEYPEIRRASHQKRSPSEHSDTDSSSGSDWGEEYSPSRFGYSSSDEEGELYLESEEM